MSLRALSHPPRRLPPLLAGAAVAVAASAVLAGAAFLTAPAPAPVNAAAASGSPPRAGGDPTTTYAYYPEQLAALSSLNSFAPVADAGRPTVSAPEPHKAERAAEAPRRTEPARPPAQPAARAAPPAPNVALARASAPKPAAQPAKAPEGWRVFGIALPRPGWPDADAVRKQTASWRDAAAELPGKALALGAGVGRLWPFGRDPQPDANSPARTN